MKVGPLTLFKRMHCNGTPTSGVVIAALHWRDSITWRWSLSLSWGGRAVPGWPAWTFRRTFRGEKGFNCHATLRFPFNCGLMLSTQPNMWRKRRSKVSAA